MKTRTQFKDILLLTALLLALVESFAGAAFGRAYYVDAKSGNDAGDALSPKTAWQTLHKASAATYGPGDRILLRKSSVFAGRLLLHATGSPASPVTVGSYASDATDRSQPIINAAGHFAGVQIVDGNNIEVRDLEITGDGGESQEPEAEKQHCGVYIAADAGCLSRNITLRSLHIHGIFPPVAMPNEGRNPVTSAGYGILFAAEGAEHAVLSGIRIENCLIEHTGFQGISGRNASGISILNNTLCDTGGPGIQPSRCRDLLVRGNLVDRSGSFVDKRMHGRGSGIWPFYCTNVLIEHNAFMHARGKADSCGAHIDYGNSNVIVQYNLSVDNEGGFCEILGNDYHCSYRYNISVNDGSRVKGVNGAACDGRILQFSGYVGHGKAPSGPFNCYVYNNTVFVRDHICAVFNISPSVRGALVANNIFCIRGTNKKENTRKNAGSFVNVRFENNLSTRPFPPGIANTIGGTSKADPRFAAPGGADPADYLPAGKAAVKGKGIVVEKLPGDSIGLVPGLAVKEDFFGNPIPPGAPDLGAIIYGGSVAKPRFYGADLKKTLN